MEVERALADLAEVRDRLASVQEFRGYSGSAAALSGAVAIAAGIVQWVVAPFPQTPADTQRYLIIWFACLAAALAINYGALLVWYVRNAGLHERRQTRSVGIAILPAVGLGAVLSLAMIRSRDSLAAAGHLVRFLRHRLVFVARHVAARRHVRGKRIRPRRCRPHLDAGSLGVTFILGNAGRIWYRPDYHRLLVIIG